MVTGLCRGTRELGRACREGLGRCPGRKQGRGHQEPEDLGQGLGLTQGRDTQLLKDLP